MADTRRVVLPDAPPIEGLAFRLYEGESDLPAILDIQNRSMDADADAFMFTVDDIRAEFVDHPSNFDPFRDALVVELRGKPVGAATVKWRQKLDNQRLYVHHSDLVPEARLPGLRQAMFSWSEHRLREIAASHHTSDEKFLEVWTKKEMNDWRKLTLANGYKDGWYMFEMRRPGLDDIPEARLPAGIELRPITRQDFRKVWDAATEAFKEERSYSEERWGEEGYRRVMDHPMLRPELWQVAWSGDQVVGAVGVMINEEENATFKRKRGWTEPVFVSSPWRRRGVAHALLAIALRSLKDLGMEEAGLNVDTDNPSGALRVYKDLGFIEDYEFIFARKPLE